MMIDYSVGVVGQQFLLLVYTNTLLVLFCCPNYIFHGFTFRFTQYTIQCTTINAHRLIIIQGPDDLQLDTRVITFEDSRGICSQRICHI